MVLQQCRYITYVIEPKKRLFQNNMQVIFIPGWLGFCLKVRVMIKRLYGNCIIKYMEEMNLVIYINMLRTFINAIKKLHL
jgi:hypothetical protein